MIDISKISGNQIEFESYIKELIGDIWKTTNKCEYRFYIHCINGSLESNYFWEDYYKLKISKKKVIEERKKIIEELINSSDIRLWCMNNILIK